MFLYLVHLLFLSLFYNVAGINLTYIVRKDKSGFSPSCAAEELERYAGIGWIYPIPKDAKQGLPTVVNKYIPTIENDFNCKFSANSHCNTIWSLKDWYIDELSPKTKEFISDTRWEDFPTVLISNSTNEFEEKVELENSFKTIFSVRADGEVEIIVSEGSSSPYSNPCYYLNIGYREIYFKKYQSLPRDIKDDFKNNYIDNYKAYSNILSPGEWRSFSWSVNVATGVAKLIDINLNRTLIERTLIEPMFSSYMYMRSANSSLWKIHQNSFLFTNTSQISRLGPQLYLPNKDLCISMLVKTCRDCYMSFFYLNMTRKILKTVGPTRNEEWIEVKLKDQNTQYDKLNLFVETLTISNSTISKFWAIDNVRVCHESEVKVSYLKLQKIEENIDDDNITCQLIKNPSWKPKKLIYDQSTDFPKISVTPATNSIVLSWPQVESTDPINYFILYEGNDRCLSEHKDLLRLKSNGFVSTKNNRIILTDLIPYTVYNLTISSILHETDKKFLVETPETVAPRLEELPSNIKLKALDTSIHVSWDSVNCSKKYGRLVYTVIVFNSTLNFSKEITIQTNSSYAITDLQPFTHYTLTILTARNGRYLYNKIHTNNFTLNFMTMPGVPPVPEKLELYSMDNNTASLRYNLPSNSHGITREIQVIRCNSLSFKKCKSAISIVKRCSMWPKKYCVEANYLIPLQSYNFKVSLKNLNTPSFGNEAVVEGKAEERIPGKPTNITYKFVECQQNTEYCHLNITWLHPYYQNGTITSFDIMLNGTDKTKDTEDDKFIHEVYNIVNKTYYYDYTYQIKYLPYNSFYNLYLSSANSAFKSESTTIQIKTDNIGDHIDQSPKLLARSHSTLLFKIPHLDSRLQFFTLTVVVQDYDKTRKVDKELLKNKKIADNLCHPYGDAWISQVIKVDSNKTENVMIGNAEKERLQPGIKYCIIFIITNQYKGREHDVVYYEKLKMMDAEPQQKEATSGSAPNHLYMLLFILLVIPVGFLLYRYLRKKRLLKNTMQTNDHVYETLPCEEIDHTNRMNGRMLQAELN